jgi:hypothetical protein
MNRRSAAGRMLSDTAYIGNRVSWKASLVLGAFFFVFLYWLVPAWLGNYAVDVKNQAVRSAIEAVLGRRIHWFNWLAVAIALLFSYFAARNYLRVQRHTRVGERNASFVARILARLLD